MVKKSASEAEQTTDDDKPKKEPIKGKDKPKSKEDTTSEGKPVEPEIKKKQASAKEIDKAQAKRLVRPKRTVKPKRKVVKAVKPEIKPRDIGVEVIPPVEGCTDPLCPFHGTLSVRGQILNGVVVNSRMDKTAIVQREIKRFIPKYERYENRTHRYAVHNPPCLNVQRGDLVRIMECRPLSKSKSFVVIEKV